MPSSPLATRSRGGAASPRRTAPGADLATARPESDPLALTGKGRGRGESSAAQEESSLFSLAALARSTLDRPTPMPAATPTPSDDSLIVVPSALLGTPVAYAAAPVAGSPFVAPPLVPMDATGTPLPTVTGPSALGGRSRSRSGTIFAVVGLGFASAALAVALTRPAPSREPGAAAASPSVDAVASPGAPAAASASAARDPEPSASARSETGPSPSASAAASATVRPPTGVRKWTPPVRPPPLPTATAVRPPVTKDPCARCGADLACNIACKAGG